MLTRKSLKVKSAAGFFLLSTFMFLILLIPAAGDESKNFYFPEVRIQIQIDKDGAFSVDEFRTYEFQGRFSWAKLWIPLRIDRQGTRYDATLEDFSITDEQGIPLRTEIGQAKGRFEAKWYYSARNERRTFHIHYRARGGVISYPDVSELYWQVIGEGWDKPTHNAVITVRLPEPLPDPGDILVYGHGPLSGSAEIVDNQTARFTATYIRSRQFVEIRMAWPAGLVSGVASDRHTMDSIRREEAQFVQDTIAKAKRDQEGDARNAKNLQRGFYAWLVLFFLGPLFWLLFYLHFWKKVGKDYRFMDIPPYAHEPASKLQPALVEVLLKEGAGITPKSFTATIFDLARRGYIEIEDRLVEKRGLFGRKDDYETTLTLRKEFKNEATLLGYERDLLEWLFSEPSDDAPQVGARQTLDNIKKYLKRNPQTFQKWYQEWAKNIKLDGKKLNFIEPASLRMRNIFLVVTWPLAVLTLNPALVALAILLIPFMKRRAQHWAHENDQWRALRRFLDDFSDFKELAPEAYKLWERYLVFGIIFGNAKKIIKTLPIILKDERAASPAWYHGYSQAAFISSGRLTSMISSIDHISSSIQQASTSAAHYSSGGGGGFSGGGGGGGGGGWDAMVV